MERGVKISHDLQTTPLKIETDSTVESWQNVHIDFFTSEGDRVGGFDIKFYDHPIKWGLGRCITSWTPFSPELPSNVHKVWVLTKLTGPRVTVQCNGVTVVDVLMSDDTCTDSRWKQYWVKDVKLIEFSSQDKASDYYKSASVTLPLGNHKYITTVSVSGVLLTIEIKKE